jgi:hypothetical protein
MSTRSKQSTGRSSTEDLDDAVSATTRSIQTALEQSTTIKTFTINSKSSSHPPDAHSQHHQPEASSAQKIPRNTGYRGQVEEVIIYHF